MNIKYKDKIADIIVEKVNKHLRYIRYQSLEHEVFLFYVDRLLNVYNYGLFQGREIIKMICRTSFNDSLLTDKESVVIIETCLDPRLDNILMEVNYNEGW